MFMAKNKTLPIIVYATERLNEKYPSRTKFSQLNGAIVFMYKILKKQVMVMCVSSLCVIAFPEQGEHTIIRSLYLWLMN